VSIDPAGIRKRIQTPSARVRAAHVVLAGNTGLGGLMPRLAATLLPVTTYVATTAPLGAKLAEAVAYAGAVTDTERADNHYRIVDGDRLLWSGGMTMWAANPRRFTKRLAADIRRTFPQLGKVEIEHVWSGTLGNAVHKMPQIGEVSRGLWLASAFGGHGFNTTAMAGELIARAIVEGDQTWRLFAPYNLVWAGGALGRAAVQIGYWSTRLAELAKARMHPKEPAAVAMPEVAEAERPAPAIDSAEPRLAASMTVSPEIGPPAVTTVIEKQSKRARPGKARSGRKAVTGGARKTPGVKGSTEGRATGGDQGQSGEGPAEDSGSSAKQPAEGTV
jgi:hypothetical protein